MATPSWYRTGSGSSGGSSTGSKMPSWYRSGSSGGSAVGILSGSVKKKKKKAKVKEEGGIGGFINDAWDEATKAVEGVAKDVYGLGSLVTEEASNLALAGKEAFTGDNKKAQKYLSKFVNKAGEATVGMAGSLSGTVADIVDLSTGFQGGKYVRGAATSLMEEFTKATAGANDKQAKQIIKPFAPKSLGKRIEERGFLSPIVEDIGNVALIGHAAGVPIKAAGLEDTGLGKAVEAAKHPVKGAYEKTIRKLTQAAEAHHTGAPTVVDEFTRSYYEKHGKAAGAEKPTTIRERNTVDQSAMEQIAAEHQRLPTEGRAATPESRAAALDYGKETTDIFSHLTDPEGPVGLKVDFVDTAAESPYVNEKGAVNQEAMKRDIIDNGHMTQVRTGGNPTEGAGHPLITNEVNDMGRVVHDFYHAVSGGDFSMVGEENAALHEAQLYSPKARQFLMTDRRGPTAEFHLGAQPGKFGPQRAGLLPEEMTTSGATLPVPGTLAERVMQALHERPISPLAGKLVGKLNPEGIVTRTLSRLEGKSLANDTKLLTRELGQQVETTRNELLHKNMVVSNVEAGRFLVEKYKLAPTVADTIMGEVVHSRLTPARIAYAPFEAKYGAILREKGVIFDDLDALPEDVQKAMIDERGPNGEPGANEAEWRARVAKATVDTKAELDTRVSALVESRVGIKGLESIGKQEVGMTKSEVRELKKAERMIKQAAKEHATFEKELAQAEETRTNLRDERVKNVTALEAEVKTGAEAVDRLFEARSPDLKALRVPEVWQNEILPGMLEMTRAQAEAGEPVGFTYNVRDAAYVDATTNPTDYVTGVVPQTIFQVPVEQWPELGPQVLDQLGRGFSDVWTDPSMNIGVWEDAGIMHVDISQVVPDRQTAIMLGNARFQDSIWSLGGEEAIPTKDVANPNISGHMANSSPTVAKARWRVGDSLDQGAKDPNYPLFGQADADAAMRVNDFNAMRAHMNNPKRYPEPGSLYREMEVQWRKRPSQLPEEALHQLVLNKQLGMGLWREAQKKVKTWEKDSKWYYDGHDSIEAHFRPMELTLPSGERVNAADLMYDLIAITSVNGTPVSNMGNALRAMANMKNLTAQQAADMVLRAYESSRTSRLEQVRDLVGYPKDSAPEGWEESSVHMYDQVKRNVALRLIGLPGEGTRSFMDWDSPYLEQAGTQWGSGVKDLSISAAFPAEDVRAALDNYNARTGENVSLFEWKKKPYKDAMREEMTRLHGKDDFELRMMEYHGSSALAKMKSFRDNLSDPHNSTLVTLDSWMARLLGVKDWQGKGAYAEYAVKIRKLADDISRAEGRKVMPHEVQATLWAYSIQEIQNGTMGAFNRAAQDTVAQIHDGTWTSTEDAMHQYLKTDVDEVETAAQYAGRQKKGERGVYEPTEREVKIVDEQGRKRTVKQTHAVRSSTYEQNKVTYDWYHDYQAVQAEAHDLYAAGDTQGAAKVISDWTASKQRVLAKKSDGAHFGAPLDDLINTTDKIANAYADIKKGEPVDGDTLSWQKYMARTADDMNPEEVFQMFNEDIKGAYLDKGGRRIISLFKTADPTTWLHESAHMMRRLLPDADLRTLEEGLGMRRKPGQYEVTVEWAADKNTMGTKAGESTVRVEAASAQEAKLISEQMVAARGKEPIRSTLELGDMTWTRGFEERFADHLFAYIMGGAAPRGLEVPFARLRAELNGHYQEYMSRFGETAINEESKAVFDNWFADESIPNVKMDVAPGTNIAIAENQGQFLPQLVQEEGTPLQIARRTPEGIEASTPGRGYQKGTKAMSAARDFQDSVKRSQQISASIKRIDNAEVRLTKQINELDFKSRIRSEKHTALAEAKIDKLAAGLEHASAARWPREWGPVQVVWEQLAKEAKSDPAKAAMLEDIDVGFSAVLRRAAELGFEPSHLRDFSEAEVKRLMFDTIRLGEPGKKLGTEEAAGTRSRWTGQRQRAGTAQRSIESLAAAMVEVQHELRTNDLVDGIETYVARKAKPGDPLPSGWIDWSPTKNKYLGLKEGAAMPEQVKYIIPKEVDTVLRRMNQDYNHGVFRGLSKITSPWRGLVLTMSPRWYVNNIFGNFVMATASGVSLRDWTVAWKEYRKRDVVGPYAETPAVRGHSLVSDINQPGIMQPRSMREAMREAEGPYHKLGEARKYVGHKMRRANEVVDEFARTAVYEKVMRKSGDRLQALHDANNNLVDYGNLSPFEQSVVRAAVPFYAWQKGILKLMVRMPIDHPVLAGLTMQMGEMQRQYMQDKLGMELPLGYQGLAQSPIGENDLINTRGINPFADGLSLTTPDGIASSLNPFLEAGIRTALGAPEGGFVKKHRVNAYGVGVPDVTPGEGINSIVSGLPQVQLGKAVLGQGPNEADKQSLRTFGINTLDPAEVRKVLERTKAAREQVKNNAPFPARKKTGATKKRKLVL